MRAPVYYISISFDWSLENIGILQTPLNKIKFNVKNKLDLGSCLKTGQIVKYVGVYIRTYIYRLSFLFNPI